MKMRVSELRRIVHEAVAQAKKSKKKAKEKLEDERGPDGYDEIPAHDLSVPPPDGGRMKKQGKCLTPPVFTSEERLRMLVRKTVREALRR